MPNTNLHLRRQGRLSYQRAKSIIRYINRMAELINHDHRH
jgi:hypothetical protein